MNGLLEATEYELSQLIKQRSDKLMSPEELDMVTRHHMRELGYWLANLYMAGNVNA